VYVELLSDTAARLLPSGDHANADGVHAIWNLKRSWPDSS